MRTEHADYYTEPKNIVGYVIIHKMNPDDANSAIIKMINNLGPIEKALGYTVADITVFVFSSLKELRRKMPNKYIRRVFSDTLVLPKNSNIGELAKTAVETTEFLFEIKMGNRIGAEKMCMRNIVPVDSVITSEMSGELPSDICVHETDKELSINVCSFGIPEVNAMFYTQVNYSPTVPPNTLVTYSPAILIEGAYYYPYRSRPEEIHMQQGPGGFRCSNANPVRYIEINNASCITELSLFTGDGCKIFDVDERTRYLYPGNSADTIIIPFSGSVEFPEFMYSDWSSHDNMQIVMFCTAACTIRVTMHLANVIVFRDGLCGLKFAT